MILANFNQATVVVVLVIACLGTHYRVQCVRPHQSLSGRFLSMLSSPQNAESDCKDGVCSLPPTSTSTPATQAASPQSTVSESKSKLLDLESKIMKDWKPAKANSWPRDQPPTTTLNVDQSPPVTESSGAVEVESPQSISASEAIVTPSAATMPTTPAAEIVQHDQDLAANILEMKKLGYDEVDARRSLLVNHNDLNAAVELLAEEEDLKEALKAQIDEIYQLGWSRDAATIALKEANASVPLALSVLEQEENALEAQFTQAVTELVSWYSPTIVICVQLYKRCY